MSGAFELLQTMGRVPRPQQAVSPNRGSGRGAGRERTSRSSLTCQGGRPNQRSGVSSSCNDTPDTSVSAPLFVQPICSAVQHRRAGPSRSEHRSGYLPRVPDLTLRPAQVPADMHLVAGGGPRVSPRTIQNHYRQLEQAGFLVRSSPDRHGRTTIYLTDLVEVRPAQKDTLNPLPAWGGCEKMFAHQGDRFKRKREISRPKKKPGSRSIRAV